MTPAAAETPAAEPKKKRKKDKVRSAWISFVGRIVAQVIGAVATIVLGVMFVQKYSAENNARVERAADLEARPSSARIRRAPAVVAEPTPAARRAAVEMARDDR